ncbi:uncharacterized protein [Diabrotica undecimpunctata]|uniref:uncharacterized protein isoform X3 n=1 Tax=Diabrotica undecimpunctata TaxID=50387 RepID=UPI003B6420BD
MRDHRVVLVMESNIEIKEEFVESGQRHIENQHSTSTDRGDFKSGPEANSARAVKTEIKEEFVEGNARYVESQVSTSLDLRDLKNEPDDYNSDRTVKSEIKEMFVEDNPRYIESQLSTSLDLGDLKNEDTSGVFPPRCSSDLNTSKVDELFNKQYCTDI